VFYKSGIMFDSLIDCIV